MFKKLARFFLFFCFLLAAGCFFWWVFVTAPVAANSKETEIFVIPQGWGVARIGRELKGAGLIKSDVAFQLMVLKEGIGTQLQAGDFRLSASMNLFEVAQSLTHGTLDVWIMVPEGLRKEEVIKRIADAFLEQEVEIDTAAFIRQTANLEGYLFPDTYLIPKEASIKDIIKIFGDNFEKKYASLEIQTNLTKEQVITLASLVERETKSDKDRSIVAGILLKRLKKGWTLDVDAAAQYAKANLNCEAIDINCQWWPQISGEDLDNIQSFYNTYDNLGLPPTPICNPGLASLQAAAQPEESDYWFYLSDDSGKLHYSRTLEGQEENIEKYLQ